MAQNVSINNHLTLQENMTFQGRLYGLDPAVVRTRMEAIFRSFGLQEYSRLLAARTSGGIRRRLDIAMSMLPHPEILYLDEPTTVWISNRAGSVEMIRSIGGLRHGHLLTTHYLEEADRLSDTLCILQNGRELVLDTPANLRQVTRQELIRIGLVEPGREAEFARAVGSLPCVRQVRQSDYNLLLSVEDSRRNFSLINRFAMDQALPFGPSKSSPRPR